MTYEYVKLELHRDSKLYSPQWKTQGKRQFGAWCLLEGVSCASRFA